MRDVLDAGAVRRWCGLAADALGRTRAEIDTGTNMHLTVLAAAERVDAITCAVAYGRRGSRPRTLATPGSEAVYGGRRGEPVKLVG